MSSIAHGRGGGRRGDPAQPVLQASDAEPLTAEEMQRLIDRADPDELREARERLEQASGSKAS